MFGINSEVIGLLTNKQKFAEKIKAEAPPLLNGILELIRMQCGATDDKPTGVFFRTAKLADETTATMADVYELDPFGEPKGKPLGSIDVAAALQAIPNEAITSKLPW
jgi:hypothetical protein